MLIIAIPKSASSSLLKTLGDLYKLPANKETLKMTKIPADEYKLLWKYHSTMREIDADHVNKWVASDSFYKQHVLPTVNNQELLRNHKKVILLRDPVDIVLSYRRTQLAGLSNERIEFRGCKTEEAWISQAEQNGLLEDLRKFYNNWLNHTGEKLVIYYSDYINKPNKVINIIANYWDLPLLNQPVVIAKERYTRGSVIERYWNKTSKMLKKNLKELTSK